MVSNWAWCFHSLFVFQMLFRCSRKSAVIGGGAKSVFLTPSYNWRNWKRSMQQASLSPKTRDDVSLRQPTSQNAKLLFGFRTAEWRRKSLSVNPRLIITCILDACFVLFSPPAYILPSRKSDIYLCSEIMNEEHPGSLKPNLSSFTLFNLNHAHSTITAHSLAFWAYDTKLWKYRRKKNISTSSFSMNVHI